MGIETSCDETGAAVVIDGKLAADRTTTQVIHEQYGGVVPELASRAHEQLLAPAVESALTGAGVSIDAVDAIAVTRGPGLAGALLVGVAYAKGLATARGIQLLGVNHLEGHLWSAELEGLQLPTPFLALIISGGHTLLVGVEGLGRYTRLAASRDDAVGELFDKAGRLLGLGFPAGAALDRMALQNNDAPVQFPRAQVNGDFSFSGLKTAVLYHLRDRYPVQDGGFLIPDGKLEPIAAGLLAAAGDMLVRRLDAALMEGDWKALVITGGVASSRYLRGGFERLAERYGIPLHVPSQNFCTDNAAMIAHVGYKRLLAGWEAREPLSVDPSASLFSRELSLQCNCV